MAFSYDTSLPANLDWVRFLIQDTVSASALLSDEEINAVVSEQDATGAAIKYFAAADCLAVILTKYNKKGGGLSEKQVDNLKIVYGGRKGDDLASALAESIADLRRRGINKLPKMMVAM